MKRRVLRVGGLPEGSPGPTGPAFAEPVGLCAVAAIQKTNFAVTIGGFVPARI